MTGCLVKTSGVWLPELTLSVLPDIAATVDVSVLCREEAVVTAVFDESDVSVPCDAVVTSVFSVL